MSVWSCCLVYLYDWLLGRVLIRSYLLLVGLVEEPNRTLFNHFWLKCTLLWLGTIHHKPRRPKFQHCIHLIPNGSKFCYSFVFMLSCLQHLISRQYFFWILQTQLRKKELIKINIKEEWYCCNSGIRCVLTIETFIKWPRILLFNDTLWTT